MKRLFSIFFFVISIFLIFFSCDKNPSSPENLDNNVSIIGTWQQVHSTRYDTANNIIEDFDLDTVRISKYSFFNNTLQSLLIDTLKYQFYFLLYYHYRFDIDSLHFFPDSLLDVNNEIHYWNPVDGSFTPYFPVITPQFSSHISFLDKDNFVETRNVDENPRSPAYRLENHWKRLSNDPIDLKSELLSINPDTVNRNNKIILNFSEIESIFNEPADK